MIKLASNLGFTSHFLVDPLGFAGGLLLLWRQGHLDLDVVSHNSQAIHTKVKKLPEDLFITFAYVRPNLSAKCRFWNYCKSLSNTIQGPWIVLEDLNDIAGPEEQWGSETINNFLQRFVDAYSDCGLLDPGSSGPKFTWYRFAGNRVVQMRRLDRVLWNVNSQHVFPEAKVVVLPRLCSDHSPILFIDEAGSPLDRSLRPLRFEAAWLSREDYRAIWKDTLAGGIRPMEGFISLVTQKSTQWNRNVFGNIFQRKQKLETRIRGIQCASNFGTSIYLQKLERNLISELNEVLDQEETFWFQKSRADWVRDGDRNTRFYHNSAIIRRNKNHIRFLKINGVWTDGHLLLSSHITDYFKNLFCRADVRGFEQLAPVVETHKITTVQATNLIQRANLSEVKKGYL